MGDTTFTSREVRESDLEMLREHRNRPDTRIYLGDDREISAEQQWQWWRDGGAESVRIVRISGEEEDIGIIRVVMSSETSACVGGDVFHQHRGKGRGHGVFNLACRYARSRGATHLWLRVFLQNSAALRIYTRAGFAIPPDTLSRIEYVVIPYDRTVPGAAQPVRLHYVYMERNR